MLSFHFTDSACVHDIVGEQTFCHAAAIRCQGQDGKDTKSNEIEELKGAQQKSKQELAAKQAEVQKHHAQSLPRQRSNRTLNGDLSAGVNEICALRTENDAYELREKLQYVEEERDKAEGWSMKLGQRHGTDRAIAKRESVEAKNMRGRYHGDMAIIMNMRMS